MSKAELTRRYWADVVVTAGGIGLAGYGYLSSAQGTDKSIALSLFGCILAVGALIDILARKRTDDAVAAVETWFRSLRSDIRSLQSDIIARFGWSWSLQPEDAWKAARDLLALAETKGTECLETSSIPPDADRYELRVKSLAKVWRQEETGVIRKLVRVFCFSNNVTDKQDQDCQQVLVQILDGLGKHHDTEKTYEDLRHCIRTGRVKVLHLPYRLLVDYLTVNMNDSKYVALFSFAPKSPDDFGSVRVSDEKMARAITEHVSHIVQLAVNHCKDNANGSGKCPVCSSYCFDAQNKTLLPRDR